MTADKSGTPAAAPKTAATTAWRGGWAQGLAYGGLGFPLAFVALPLYVILPNHYASTFGIPLATLGALLLGTRLLDAVADPWIGRWVDGWFTQPVGRVIVYASVAAVVLALGFRGLFFPVVDNGPALLWWCAVLLVVTYQAFSVMTVVHQAWGARLGGNEAQRARIVSWREGLSLLGVLVASVLPAVAGLSVATVVFAAALAVGLILLARAPRPRSGTAPAVLPSMGEPLRNPTFRRLLLIYLINGVASAVPATLVLFFIRDRLQAPAFEPLFLVSYFAAGALSMPLWVRAVSRFGLAPTWLAGMLLAVATFAWATMLGAGDVTGFIIVCLASGIALGADLSLPSALLAGVIQRAGHGEKLEGGYFGWWNFATKLNLALAAGIALPLLGVFGYAPGAQDPGALRALTVAYCLLPCALKLVAAGLLYTRWIRPGLDLDPPLLKATP